LLDKSGVATTSKGFVLNLVPPGRDIRRSLRVITEEGQERLYYGISFKRT
jgi:hypothetical protein